MSDICPTCGEVCNRQLEDELNTLRGELARRNKDAARYVWLRARFAEAASALDRAIDEAMR